MANVLVTGVAGFIGMHVAERLLSEGHEVLGVDNLCDYYRVDLKAARLDRLTGHPRFSFVAGDVADLPLLDRHFRSFRPSRVIHLAAQAGVRHSLVDPHVYGRSNLIGFLNVLECCRHSQVEHLVYASSSSVYGSNMRMPFSTGDSADHPLSLYAATKRSNELMAHSYSHLFGLPTTGLRFFTVYGPWGRPDMAPYAFARAISEGTPLQIFNGGDMRRDFTFVDDVADAVVRVSGIPALHAPTWDPTNPSPDTSAAPFRVYNVGNGAPVDLLGFVALLEQHIGRSAILSMQPMQPGDVKATYADSEELATLIGGWKRTSLESGVARFAEWFCDWSQRASS